MTKTFLYTIQVLLSDRLGDKHDPCNQYHRIVPAIARKHGGTIDGGGCYIGVLPPGAARMYDMEVEVSRKGAAAFEADLQEAGLTFTKQA